MIRSIAAALVFGWLMTCRIALSADAPIPRAEHPRPDARRPHWASLNGRWEFRFDAQDEGVAAGWHKPGAPGYDRTILVPFPWESELSGIHQVKGAPQVGWYRRHFTVPKDFPANERVWLRLDAVDWRAQVWVNGQQVADHEGGYTPIEVDVSDVVTRESDNQVVVRAFDPTDPELPTGKQVGWYTPSSGIWQTVWLEARPKSHISSFQIRTLSLEPAKFEVEIVPAGISPGNYTVGLRAEDRSIAPAPPASFSGNDATKRSFTLVSLVHDPKLWSPESPNLYDLTLELKSADGQVDAIHTYFGLRTVSRGKYGDEAFERILFNGKPMYLRAALDQSFNPKGLYTAPDDDFLKRDMLIAKTMGLNALRIHIKPDEPRRLYWADQLGVLILEDMPNTWRQNARARSAWEQTMREAVVRDRNHPAIIAWVAFNETWGLGKAEDYKKDGDTQAWVARMVDQIRALDGHDRLVEDNSPCNYDHIANTDLNSWHFYIDNHEEARRHIEDVVAKTQPGSRFNYVPGPGQSSLPLINSEYGAVSAGGGDRDISWGLRDLTTQLRRHRKIQGFVYTELADIEWEHNGLVNYDRTPKRFGYETWVPDMRPNELLGADFIGYDAPPAIVGKPGQTLTIPIFVSHYSDRPGPVILRYWVGGFDARADNRTVIIPTNVPFKWRPYDVVDLEPIKVTLPDYPFVGALALTLRDDQNQRFAANFVNLVVKPDHPLPRIARRGPRDVAIRFAPADFAHLEWSDPAKAPAGKAYGHGKGYFEYRIEVPSAVVKAHPESIYYLFQAASKAHGQRADWPARVNRQDYPQTDMMRTWRSTLDVLLNGRKVDRIELPDDAADARGVLSHLAKVEHGSHGELVDGQATLTDRDRALLAAGEPLVLRLAVPPDSPQAGGLCIFGASTGEMPLDPTLQIHTRDPLPADLGVDPYAPAAVPPRP